MILLPQGARIYRAQMSWREVVSPRRYVTLQTAEVAASRQMFQEIVPPIGHLLWLGTIGFIFASVTGLVD